MMMPSDGAMSASRRRFPPPLPSLDATGVLNKARFSARGIGCGGAGGRFGALCRRTAVAVDVAGAAVGGRAPHKDVVEHLRRHPLRAGAMMWAGR